MARLSRASASTVIPTAIYIKENGKTISNKEVASSNLPTVLPMKGSFITDSLMDKEYTSIKL